MTTIEAFHRLGIALALGLLVGIERGWRAREAGEGERVAGTRTFALLGLLGGATGLLARIPEAAPLLPVTLGLVGLFLALGYWLTAQRFGVVGLTTEVAALGVFACGVLAALDRALVAAAAAVATTILLGAKGSIHGFVAGLDRRELQAAGALLLISVVVLPILPREAVDPWGVLVPYEIWWMVVLIAALSFVGYFAVRALGARRGLGITAFFGGLVSSTAVALSFARLGRARSAPDRVLAAGVVLASSIMPIRVLVEVAVVNHALLPRLGPPLGAMAAAGFLSALALWRPGEPMDSEERVSLRNPLELSSALKFGVLLVAILLLAEGARAAFGSTGVYLLAAASGIADVDAITVSLSRLARDSVPASVAVTGITVAAAVNTAVKAVLVAAIARGVMARRTTLAAALMVGAALAALLVAG